MAIVDFISDDNPDAAKLLKDDIEAKAAKLPEHPRLYWAVRIEGSRDMVVRTNYIVINGRYSGRSYSAGIAFGAAVAFNQRIIRVTI